MKSDGEQKAVGKLGVVPHRVVDVIDYQAGATGFWICNFGF